MRTWRDLRRAQREGEASASAPQEDEWAWMLAPDTPRPPIDNHKRLRMKSFEEIVMEVNDDEEGSDWRDGCEWCVGQHASPWEHYLYHRRRGRAAQETGDTEPAPDGHGTATNGRRKDNDGAGGE